MNWSELSSLFPLILGSLLYFGLVLLIASSLYLFLDATTSPYEDMPLWKKALSLIWAMVVLSFGMAAFIWFLLRI